MNLLKVDGLKKHYPIQGLFGDKALVKALDGVSFEVEKKHTLAIVGESGCGKSTLAKTLMGLEEKTSGEVLFEGKKSQALKGKELYQTIQMIFQDPYNSLNPRKKAWKIIAEPLLINNKVSQKEAYNKACELMEKVGLRAQMANRYPHMFSGGQRQRLGIARALILNPKILICDEPISALDVSIQAQVLNLLVELQDQLDLTYLFISHDLNVVKHIADSVLVMYLGKVVEYGKRQEIFENPQHPYTRALLEASPNIFEPEKEHNPLSGEPPSPLNPPTGCAFHERCPLATEKCHKETPQLESILGRKVACFNLNQ